MAETTYAALALILAVVYLLYYRLQQWRFKTFAHIPTPIKPSTLLGHLGYMAAGFKKYDAKAHPGKAFLECVV